MREEIATSAALPRRGRGASRGPLTLLAATLLAGLVGACGGGERRDANEPEGEFPIEVVSAKFQTEQRLAETTDLIMEIENTGEETVPDLAVTINTGEDGASGAFSIQSDQPGLADPNRPVWVLENDYPKLVTSGLTANEFDAAPPAGAAAAQTNTFSFGSLEPGESREIVWRLTPTMAGTFTVRYEIAAGLHGKAKAVTGDGGPVEGQFVVTITDKPPRARVDSAGNVVIEDR